MLDGPVSYLIGLLLMTKAIESSPERDQGKYLRDVVVVLVGKRAQRRRFVRNLYCLLAIEGHDRETWNLTVLQIILAVKMR